MCPPGTKPSPEQIAVGLMDSAVEEEWCVEIIKARLRTPEQRAWLEQHDLTIGDLLGGRTRGLSEEVSRTFFEPWNAALGKRVFGY